MQSIDVNKDLDLLDSIFEIYDKSDEDKLEEDKSEEHKHVLGCEHFDLINENGMIVCNDCGQEIKKVTNNIKEWRYFNSSDKKNDPNRVQVRKIEERSIFKDVENLGFSEKIIMKANNIYQDVTSGQIFRGKSRKAIVFACIFHAYKINNIPQTPEQLIDLFKIDRKDALKGIKYVNMHAPHESDIYLTSVSPINHIHEIMDKFTASDEYKKEVEELYKKIKNKSSNLNRARPKSVSSALVYYWIKQKKIDININEFAIISNLSQLTINKITKEIENILKKM